MVELQLMRESLVVLKQKKKKGTSKISPTHNFVKELSPGNELQNNKYLCLASHHLNRNIQNNLRNNQSLLLVCFSSISDTENIMRHHLKVVKHMTDPKLYQSF